MASKDLLDEMEQKSNFTTLEGKQIIKLLKNQNEILSEIRDYMDSTTNEDDRDDQLNLRSTISAVDMPISSMVKLIFKWFVASLPLGLLITLIYVFLAVIIGGLSYFG